jgi:hypothetical protein
MPFAAPTARPASRSMACCWTAPGAGAAGGIGYALRLLGARMELVSLHKCPFSLAVDGASMLKDLASIYSIKTCASLLNPR